MVRAVGSYPARRPFESAHRHQIFIMIQEKILQTIKRYHMFRRYDKVLVCISGGFDSTALLLILNELKEKLSIDIQTAHLNHMLRGKESDEDEKFVRELTDRLGIPLTVKRKDVLSLAEKRKVSLEDAARSQRYEFFFKTANRIKAQKIALGHTQDDQAETFLMRILRGSGLCGLSSIWPIRKINDYVIVRPLIQITKDEIIDYLKEKDIKARLDSSNLSDMYLRNRIRLNLVPYVMREFNPNIKETLAKEAELIRGVYDYINRKVERFFKKKAKIKNKIVILNLKDLNRKETAIMYEILRRCIYLAKGNLNRITFNHILNLHRIIRESSGTTTLDLPELRVSKEYDQLKFYKRRIRKTKGSVILPDKLKVPGITEIHDLGIKIKAEILPKDRCNLKKNKGIEYIDYDKIDQPIKLRFRQPHDRFMPLGMRKEKKLKDFFIDSKISRDERDRILLAVSGNEIIWVVGYRISEKVKVTQRSKKVIKLGISRGQVSTFDIQS